MNQRQKGLSYFGVVFAVGLFGLLIKVGAAVGPVYLDHMTISKLVTNAIQDPETKKMAPKEFKDYLNRAFNMNNMSDRKAEDLLKFSPGSDGYVVDLEYEERKNLIANMDVVVYFAKSYSAEHPEGVDIVASEGQ